MASILMIDDDGFYRGIIERALADHGYSVVTAQNGVEGIALYRDQSPDLVITDMNMPGLDGSEVIRTVREINSRATIIALSGEPTFHAVDYLKLAAV
jgi:sigma-B regulation protein RsbU (phosphoserine phosphatase)